MRKERLFVLVSNLILLALLVDPGSEAEPCALRTVPVMAVLIALTAFACAPEEPEEEAFTPEIPEIPDLPLGLDAELFQVPEDNPMTAEKVALGWQLFYDQRLSVDSTISCASCHLSDAGFADPRKGSVGVGGAVGGRNAPR